MMMNHDIVSAPGQFVSRALQTPVCICICQDRAAESLLVESMSSFTPATERDGVISSTVSSNTAATSTGSAVTAPSSAADEGRSDDSPADENTSDNHEVRLIVVFLVT